MHAPNINPQDPRWQNIVGNSPAAGGAQQWPTKEIIEAQQAQNGAQGVNAAGANPTQADAAQVRAYLEEAIEQRDNQIAQVKELLARMKQVLTGGRCAPESNGYISTTPVGPEKL